MLGVRFLSLLKSQSLNFIIIFLRYEYSPRGIWKMDFSPICVMKKLGEEDGDKISAIARKRENQIKIFRSVRDNLPEKFIMYLVSSWNWFQFWLDFILNLISSNDDCELRTVKYPASQCNQKGNHFILIIMRLTFRLKQFASFDFWYEPDTFYCWLLTWQRFHFMVFSHRCWQWQQKNLWTRHVNVHFLIHP